jgi:hypothetical protein
VRATVVVHHAVNTVNPYNIPSKVSEVDYSYVGDITFRARLGEQIVLPDSAASSGYVTVLLPLSAVVSTGDRVTVKDRNGGEVIKRWRVLVMRRHDRRLMLRCVRGEH